MSQPAAHMLPKAPDDSWIRCGESLPNGEVIVEACWSRPQMILSTKELPIVGASPRDSYLIGRYRLTFSPGTGTVWEREDGDHLLVNADFWRPL